LFKLINFHSLLAAERLLQLSKQPPWNNAQCGSVVTRKSQHAMHFIWATCCVVILD